jgi:ribosomal protein L28
MDHFFLFICRTHAAQRTVDRLACNLQRVVLESSQERSIRVSICTNSIHVRDSPINFNS